MNKELLRELLMAAKGIEASPAPPSERANDRFEAFLAKYAPAVVTETQMKILILKILSKGRADGAEVAEGLQELKVHLPTPGEGLIFALLARMEMDGTIAGRFNEEMSQKTYMLTERGIGLMEQESGSVQGLNPLVSALWGI